MTSDPRASVEAAFKALHDAICALGIGDIDPEPRSEALEFLIRARGRVMRGLEDRYRERRVREAAEKLGLTEHELRELCR